MKLILASVIGLATLATPVAATTAAASTPSQSVGTPPSASELIQIRDALTTRQPFAGVVNASLATWYADTQTGVVVAGVTRVTPKIVDAARVTWGSAVKVVQQDRPQLATRVSRMPGKIRKVDVESKSTSGAGNPTTLATAPYPSRLLDAQPYYGGTRIGIPNYPSSGYITECTAAFNDTRNQMLTSGHCFNPNHVVQQGYLDTATSTWNYTGNMGRTDWVQWGNNRPDAEELNPAPVGAQAPAGNIYWNLQTSYVAKGNSYRTQKGQRFCTNGSFTGENCNGIVDAVGVCVKVDDDGTLVTVCNLISGHSENGSRLSQHGDSGGPVYVHVTGGVQRSGIISAGNIGPGQAGNHVWFTDLKVLCVTYGRC
jgi:hypothetical protein